MDFVDLAAMKITTVNRYSTIKVPFKADRFLDAKVSEGAEYIDSLLKVRFRSPSVLYRVDISGEELETEDFEYICETLVAEILRHNSIEEERTDRELLSILNLLPGHRWLLKHEMRTRVNADVSTLVYVAKHYYRNRNINIVIETVDGKFKYELIGPGDSGQ